MDDYSSLRHLVQTHPLIDNHAHNILGRDVATDYDSYPLESIVSEAHGRAMANASTTLPMIRAIKQLPELYGTSSEDWNELVEARNRWVKDDYEGLVRRSLEGTHTLLLDDLLSEDDVEAYSWHDRFTTTATKRIVRIEAVAASLLADLMDYQRKPDETVWGLFRQRFLDAIDHAMDDPAVVGFKSVICYRTGLDVDPYSADEDTLTASLHRTLDSGTRKSGYRVEDKPLNDWLVQQTLKAVTFKKAARIVKPIQFHTGLGDNDISLVKANPAHLQPLIAQYQNADIVLLHSAYPFTREAGYLASVYPNVYLDLGEVFPMVSRDGQEKILRQSLEIAPMNRLLWSTDGHFHPETFWLANRQFRQALEKVLVEYVQCGDLTSMQAENAAKGCALTETRVRSATVSRKQQKRKRPTAAINKDIADVDQNDNNNNIDNSGNNDSVNPTQQAHIGSVSERRNEDTADGSPARKQRRVQTRDHTSRARPRSVNSSSPSPVAEKAIPIAQVEVHLSSLKTSTIVQVVKGFTSRYPELAMIHLPTLLKGFGVSQGAESPQGAQGQKTCQQEYRVLMAAILAAYMASGDRTSHNELYERSVYEGYAEKLLSNMAFTTPHMLVAQALLIIALLKGSSFDLHKAWMYCGSAIRTMQFCYGARRASLGNDPQSISWAERHARVIESRTFWSCFNVSSMIDLGTLAQPLLPFEELERMDLLHPLNHFEFALGMDTPAPVPRVAASGPSSMDTGHGIHTKRWTSSSRNVPSRKLSVVTHITVVFNIR
ncbi:unnamed protein product [Penicillium pancosmium]